MIIFCVLHLLRVAIQGAYRPPREMTWLVGVGLLLLTLGFGFTGYLLPWDERAFWATTVGTQIAGSVPLIGNYIQDFLRGGPDLSALTLSRFFDVHVLVLPAPESSDPIATVIISNGAIGYSGWDIQARVREGRFREDIFWRLNVIPLQLPPLRERPEDLEPFSRHFLGRFARDLGQPHVELEPAALERLAQHPWPGNLRQLHNVLWRATLLSGSERLSAEHLSFDALAA